MIFPRVQFSTLNWQTIPFLLILTAIAIPYYAHEPAPADIISGLAITVFLASILLRKSTIRIDRSDWFLLGFIALIVVQEIFTFAANLRFTLISLYLFALYFALKHYVSSLLAVQWFFRVYLFASVITVLVMVIQLVATYSFNISGLGLYFDRPDGLFKDANVAGPALLLAVAYCQYFYLKTHHWKNWLAMLFFMTGVFLSFSRGAYLGLIGSVLLTYILGYAFIVFFQKGSWKAYMLPVLISTVSVPLLWFSLQLYPPFSSLTQARFGTLVHDYDTAGRVVSWTAGLNDFIRNPLGTGSGSYEKDSQNYQQQLTGKTKQSSTSSIGRKHIATGAASIIPGDRVLDADGNEIIVTPSAHNTFIRVLKENGILGFGLLIAFLSVIVYATVKNLWKYRRDTQPLLHYYAVVAIGLVTLLPMGTFIDTLHWRSLWYVLGVAAGIGILFRQIEQDHGQQKENT